MPEGRAVRRALAWLRKVVATSRSTDADGAVEILRAYADGRWYLVALRYVGHTMESVVAGVLLLLGNWRLLVMELVPALWLGAITWDWRARTFGQLPLAEVHGAAAAVVTVLILVMTFAAYWCNAVFAFAAVQRPPIDQRSAAVAASVHWRRITAWALVAGVAHVVVAVVVTRTTVPAYSVALGAVVVLQMYGLVAMPVALVARTRVPSRGRRERIARLLLAGALSGVASSPGFILNRIGILCFALGLPWLGVILLVPAVVVQAAGAASSRAVQLAARVQEAKSLASPR